MKIIVTGATGFIGRNICESFHADGTEVVATGRSADAGGCLERIGIQYRRADLLSPEELIDAFSPADCVIHCAARCGPWGNYKEFYEANVTGTRNVVAACRKHQIKTIIFISTPSIYFSNRDRLDISEADPLPARISTHYAKTKLIAENELLALAPEGFKVIILRPRAVFGPYDNTIIPRILRLAEKKKMPTINGGQALLDITYIDNLTDAVRLCLEAPDSAWNEIFNISNGDPIYVKDWFSQVLNVFERPFRPKNVPEKAAKLMAGVFEFIGYLPFVKKEPPMTRFAVSYMAKSMTMSIDKAERLLGYKPKVGNREGFEKYAKWYHEEQNTL